MQLFVRQIYSPLDLINMNFPIPQFEQIHKSATRPAQCNTSNCICNVSIGADHMEELKMLELL